MEPLRAAGSNERRCIARDVLGLYGYVSATAKYAGPTILNKSIVYEALKRCIAEHPMLSIVIQDADSLKPQLARAVQLDLKKLVRYCKSIDEDVEDPATRMKRILERIHNEPPTEYGHIPQWRLWVFSFDQGPSKSSKATFYVTFAYSHAVADGMSSIAFHRSFVKAISGLDHSNTQVDAICEVKSENELPPALDDVSEMSISWSFFIKAVVMEYLPEFIARALGLNDDPKDPWSGAATPPNLPPRPQLVRTTVEVLYIPSTTLQRVLKTCRDHDSRLTALVNHLTARAIAWTLKTNGQDLDTFVIETSTDLRRSIVSARNRMANYASANMQVHKTVGSVDPAAQLNTEDWETIRRNTAELNESSSKSDDQVITLLRYISDFQQWNMKRISQVGGASFGNSNVGAFMDDRSGEKQWQIAEMVFSQSADAGGLPFNINLASVKDGPLAITATWLPGRLGTEDEEVFMREVLNTVAAQMDVMV